MVSLPIMGASAYFSGVHRFLYSSGRAFGSQLDGQEMMSPDGLRSGFDAYFRATAVVRFPPAEPPMMNFFVLSAPYVEALRHI